MPGAAPNVVPVPEVPSAPARPADVPPAWRNVPASRARKSAGRSTRRATQAPVLPPAALSPTAPAMPMAPAHYGSFMMPPAVDPRTQPTPRPADGESWATWQREFISTRSPLVTYPESSQPTEIWNHHPLLHLLYSKFRRFDRQDSSVPALPLDLLDMAGERSILLDTATAQGFSMDSFFFLYCSDMCSDICSKFLLCTVNIQARNRTSLLLLPKMFGYGHSIHPQSLEPHPVAP